MEPEKVLNKTSPLIDESFFKTSNLIVLDEGKLAKNDGTDQALII